MALVLTQYSGQLASQLVIRRRSATAGAREETGLQKLPLLRSNAGNVYTIFYDPDADVLLYDTGTPVLSQQ